MTLFKPGSSATIFSPNTEKKNYESFEYYQSFPRKLEEELYPPQAGNLSLDEIEMAFYETFFFEKEIEPYPVQEEAFTKIFANENVLVTVPTGTGKTMMAKAGLYKALYSNQTAIYTTPLRALTEEKYRELCDDFGEKYVGFATGDYKVNAHAPIQVVVAEILWNRIFSDPTSRPADVVIMDEGHYFNAPERGYVWEQSIIGLHPMTQLIVLSATVGNPRAFCQWAYIVRKEPMALVQSHTRRIPLTHQYQERYLLEVVKELFGNEDTPAIIFTFGRKLCFERARLLKSCRRFVTLEEQKKIEEIASSIIIPQGFGEIFFSLLMHGIGIHHAGILPAYKHLVEQLTLQRLLKFIISTETISAGLNLPARCVIFPELRKVIRRKKRLLNPAEYHQMAGRAGRPQFDQEGLAITLAPEDVVQEFRKELKESQKARRFEDEATIKKRAYSRALQQARQRGDVIWNQEAHEELVKGQPADLKSHTKITAEQILAIGLPDLSQEALPGFALVQEEKGIAQKKEQEAEERAKRNVEKKAKREAEKKEQSKQDLSAKKGLQSLGQLASMLKEPKHEPSINVPKTNDTNPNQALNNTEKKTDKTDESETNSLHKKWILASQNAPRTKQESLPAYMNLHIKTIIDNLLLQDIEKHDAHKVLAKITANLHALNILDDRGIQVRGKLIGQLRGIDGPFIYHCLMNHELPYESSRELLEYIIDHDVIQRLLDRKKEDARREWIRERLRERRRDAPQVTWEDVEAEYETKFPRELSTIETIHHSFLQKIPHPELHDGKKQKNVWTLMEESGASFMEFVEEHHLETEEGSLFTYLARVMKTARMLYEVTTIPDFLITQIRIRDKLAVLDERILHEF